ncbi:jg23988, partial [Pararge aegeria aegeria]
SKLKTLRSQLKERITAELLKLVDNLKVLQRLFNQNFVETGADSCDHYERRGDMPKRIKHIAPID